ncbi:MAG TPA: hypothetical protein VJN18_27465 [Polyangiaceae bacterium]|nr:hypothetical protein [Polyangiaceae bacterium]
MLHDVGTLSETSGQRLNGPLTGLDTPTLLGVWETAPYLHDGSAPTLLDVLTTKNRDESHGATSSLTELERNQLVHYLLELDGRTPPEPLPFEAPPVELPADEPKTDPLAGAGTKSSNLRPPANGCAYALAEGGVGGVVHALFLLGCLLGLRARRRR